MITIALVVGAVIIAVPVLTLLAVLGHLVMVPVRETTFGKWAGKRAEARMDRVRVAWIARKGTKAGAQ